MNILSFNGGLQVFRGVMKSRMRHQDNSLSLVWIVSGDGMDIMMNLIHIHLSINCERCDHQFVGNVGQRIK